MMNFVGQTYGYVNCFKTFLGKKSAIERVHRDRKFLRLACRPNCQMADIAHKSKLISVDMKSRLCKDKLIHLVRNK